MAADLGLMYTDGCNRFYKKGPKIKSPQHFYKHGVADGMFLVDGNHEVTSCKMMLLEDLKREIHLGHIFEAIPVHASTPDRIQESLCRMSDVILECSEIILTLGRSMSVLQTHCERLQKRLIEQEER